MTRRCSVLHPRRSLVLAVAEESDGMDDAERARLHESLRRSIAQAEAGQLIDGDEVIDRLLARR